MKNDTNWLLHGGKYINTDYGAKTLDEYPPLVQINFYKKCIKKLKSDYTARMAGEFSSNHRETLIELKKRIKKIKKVICAKEKNETM